MTPPEANLHGDALCFIVKTTRHKTVCGLRLVAVGGWRLVVPFSFRTVLNKKKRVLKDSPGSRGAVLRHVLQNSGGRRD